MEWPDNPIARALKAAYEKGCFEVVTVEAYWFDPLHLRITIKEATCGDVTCEMALPDYDIDDVEFWAEEIAWHTGARDMCRWASPDRYIKIGEAVYRWTWKPTYQRFQSPCFRRWIGEDATLDEDGGRSQAYPYHCPESLLEAMRMYPAHGSGRELCTLFEFVRRKR